MSGRIMAIDYGRKRVGLAVTDPLKIIATGLSTIHPKDFFTFFNDYLQKEKVESVVIGYPIDLKNQPSDAVRFIDPFIRKFKKSYPSIPIEIFDERFTSKLAKIAMLEGGLKKKDRQDKALTDKLSAIIILQSFMNYKKNE